MTNQKAAISTRRKSIHTSIVASSPPQTQSQKLERLNQAITRRELTESLEILAQSHIEGDLAIFVISNLLDLMTWGCDASSFSLAQKVTGEVRS